MWMFMLSYFSWAAPESDFLPCFLKANDEMLNYIYKKHTISVEQFLCCLIQKTLALLHAFA